MTYEQQEQIIDLRKKGYGYRLIGQMLGINRDMVRYFCKSNGMAGITEDVPMPDGEACPCCGGAIQQTAATGRRKKFCSEKCRREWWKKHPGAGKQSESAIYHSTCAACGKEFTAYGNSSRKYCSHACYILHRFGQK